MKNKQYIIEEINKILFEDVENVDDVSTEDNNNNSNNNDNHPRNDTEIRDAILTSFATYMGRKVHKRGKLAKDPNGRDHAVDMSRHSYSPEGGLFMVRKVRDITSRGPYKGTHHVSAFKVVNRKLITADTDKIVKKMFGNNHGEDDISTSTATWELAKKSKQLKDVDIFNMFCGSVKNILQSIDVNMSSLPDIIRKDIERVDMNKYNKNA